VRLLRGQHRRWNRNIGEADIDSHAELLGQWSELCRDGFAWYREAIHFELDPLKEDGSLTRTAVDVLLSVDNVPISRGNELGGCCDNSALIGAREKKHC